MLPLSDFAIIKVFPCPEHVSLNAVLWKLWSLALKINFAVTIDLLACDKIDPILFNSSFSKTFDASLNTFSTITSFP